MRLEILLTALLFWGGTYLSGKLLCGILKIKDEDICFNIVSGTVLWWALMEMILIPMTMKLASFQSFVMVYTTVILFLMLGGLFFWKEILEDVKALPQKIFQNLTLGYVVAFFLICYQLYFLHHHMYLEWDDTYYVNLANEAVYSNKIYWVYPETGALADFDKRYVLSLWPIFYAWLAKLMGVIPTIMAHTILPWLMIPLAYMVYYLIGKRLFKEDRELQGMFLAMAVLLHLYMSGQHTSGLTFLSITPWVGKGVLAAILIPLLFYWILRLTEESRRKYWLMLGMTGLGGCLLSSMGIMLSPVFIGTAVFLVSLGKKKFSYVGYGVAASLPCVLLGVYYIYLTH